MSENLDKIVEYVKELEEDKAMLDFLDFKAGHTLGIFEHMGRRGSRVVLHVGCMLGETDDDGEDGPSLRDAIKKAMQKCN